LELNAGTTILGRVELLREEPPSVGVQVFGPTWVVLDSESGELARACVLDAELLPDAVSRDAFTAGLANLASLRDATLVPQLLAGADTHGGGVVYEPVPGGVAFDDLYDGTGSFELSAEVGRLARQLARALASLHAHGVVHGMLTSACVFVGPRGPAIYQYGLAPLCDRAVLLRRVRAFGLPNLAPEILAGGEFTPAADLYAWAVTVAQFATGSRGSESLAAVHGGHELPGLGSALRAVLQACLAEDPAARPRDGGELLRLIELAGLGEGSGAIRSGDVGEVAVPPEDSPAVAEDSSTRLGEAAPDVVAVESVPPSSPVTETRPPRPPTIPPRLAPPAPSMVPRGNERRPITIPPTALSLPVTSFEEMLMTGDRQRRPGTIPPGSLQVPAGVTPPPPGPAAAASASNRIELSPEDLLNESGNWSRGGLPAGKSASASRRVRVLTDPLKRTGEISTLTPVPRMQSPEDSDTSDSSLTRTPVASPGALIIGGTREQVDAASRATTVRLDPAAAATAVQAANDAAMTESERSTAGAEASRASDADIIPLPLQDSGAPLSSSAGRRRSSAVSAVGNAEPRDWGTIPPVASMTPVAPPSAAVVPAAPSAVDIQELRSTSKLIPILVLVALALLAILFAS
jgi:serine/threonine protein kinase